MKWHAHRDWAGCSLGWYPTDDDPRMFILQKINWSEGVTRRGQTHRD